LPNPERSADLKTVLARKAHHRARQGSNACYCFDEIDEQWLIDTDPNEAGLRERKR
jgi:hypothetical protein